MKHSFCLLNGCSREVFSNCATRLSQRPPFLLHCAQILIWILLRIYLRASADPAKPAAGMADHLPHCGRPFQDVDHCQRDPAFHPYRTAALRGEKLLDDDAECGASTWTSPLELARLMLMRRIPRPLPREVDLWRYRVLGAIILDLDNVIAKETSFPPSPKRPILPLHFRPALLAGASIVERAGPEMLKMLRGHTFGDNRNHFTEAAERLIAQAPGSLTLRQI